MKATVLDLRRRTKTVISALDQNEPVTIFYRGREKGVIYPSGRGRNRNLSVAEHPAFGMWKDRADLKEVSRMVRELRKGRGSAL